ncbi:hypothetical protein WJX81_002281 [Elliptochloris bilobata]|uniref:Uncharacterized protein n=1 Tax=Elliptochloris bilobata TaxID=381761 RepID=A0AAW1RZN5_9CHLO
MVREPMHGDTAGHMGESVSGSGDGGRVDGDAGSGGGAGVRLLRSIRVCADSVCGLQMGSESGAAAAAWPASEPALNALADTVGDGAASIGFANEGQFLLASEASLGNVNARLRPTDGWRMLALGEAHFSVAGPCARCEVAQALPPGGIWACTLQVGGVSESFPRLAMHPMHARRRLLGGCIVSLGHVCA